MEGRELLDQLGRSFDLLKAAHYSIRASLRDRKPFYMECAVRQWATAVEEYTHAVEELMRPKPVPPRESAEVAVERVRARVLGRIRQGRFIAEED